jgi:hypothetical protein
LFIDNYITILPKLFSRLSISSFDRVEDVIVPLIKQIFLMVAR